MLFGDTIANNIRIGKPDATDEEVIQAARRTHAHEFIEQLDDGYKRPSAPRGRAYPAASDNVSIARAFLKDAPIIVLDEPTSALDAESEHQIQAALEDLSRAHRADHRPPFQHHWHADRILVFDAGKIVANGTHNNYTLNELYRSLYDKQSRLH